MRDIEEENEKVKVQVGGQETKLSMYEKEQEKLDEKRKSRMKLKRKIEADVQEIVRESEAEEGKLEPLRSAMSQELEKTRAAKRLLQEVKDNHDKVSSERTALEAEIEKLRRTGTEEFEEKHRQRLAAIKRCQEQIEENMSRQATTENHLEHVTRNQRDVDSRVMELRAEKEREGGQKMKIKQKLDTISRSGQNRLAAFADWMPGVVEDIRTNRRFKTTPIGPLGLHIKVNQILGASHNKVTELICLRSRKGPLRT